MKRPIYTVLVRIMHTRRECKIWTIHPVGFRRTEESNYGHREGKNGETTSGWIYIITRSGLRRQGIRIVPRWPKDYRSLERVVTISSTPFENPSFLPILFLLDRYPSRKRLLNRFNVLGQNDRQSRDRN